MRLVLRHHFSKYSLNLINGKKRVQIFSQVIKLALLEFSPVEINFEELIGSVEKYLWIAKIA